MNAQEKMFNDLLRGCEEVLPAQELMNKLSKKKILKVQPFVASTKSLGNWDLTQLK